MVVVRFNKISVPQHTFSTYVGDGVGAGVGSGVGNEVGGVVGRGVGSAHSHGSSSATFAAVWMMKHSSALNAKSRPSRSNF